MTGVSYMIPFVAAGGLLIALSFLLGGYEIVGPYGEIAVNNTLFNLPDPGALGLEHALFDSGLLAYIGALFFVIGKTGVHVLRPGAGRLHRLRDRRPPRHRPRLRHGRASPSTSGGFGTTRRPASSAASSAACSPAWSPTGSRSWKVPTWARGLMPVLVIPLFATLIAGFLMIVVFGKPLGWLMDQLTDGLNQHERQPAAILLGVILGLMMAFDMGGPLNKVAYASPPPASAPRPPPPATRPS